MNVEFFVPGNPQGKARPRVVRRKDGRSMTYTPDKTVQYEELVRQRYIAQSEGYRFAPDVPLSIIIQAEFSIPKNTSQKRRKEMLQGAILPTKRPDFDNIAKIICDALNGIAYPDDSQIVLSLVVKRYAQTPGVKVEVGNWR